MKKRTLHAYCVAVADLSHFFFYIVVCVRVSFLADFVFKVLRFTALSLPTD